VTAVADPSPPPSQTAEFAAFAAFALAVLSLAHNTIVAAWEPRHVVVLGIAQEFLPVAVSARRNAAVAGRGSV